MLVAAFALAVVLMKPLPGRAETGTTDPVPAPPPTTDATPVDTQLPVVTVPQKPVWHRLVKHKAAPHRTTQLHITFGRRVVDYAKRFRGVRYVWGGSSPRYGFDCSGFVRYVYGHFGISLAHSSYAQFDRGRRVSRRGLKPGDLVFFHGLGHVGIYVGNGRFIHAPHSGSSVRIEQLGGWYSSSYDGARRLRAA
jgi:cell wall-associated NlpC family hydrolase